ncbi:MAG: class I SAM-dependent methyltransferase [Alphaproteobacteria bacterium]|nr:SAM-dependent methyltransferase [Hyphomonas sp.]MBR9806073.1 class I SAM-dependent methyltransferase [Alphaproteobacteria bacterium]|tara:strand:- start:213 stop:1280 length:1068 start_codon:yes stop_codon:yes gene_type:complete
MSLFDLATRTAGRARYAAAQGLRSAWYGAQMRAVRQQTGGLSRPGEPAFEPSRGTPDMAALRRAYFQLFLQDRLNVEKGLYPAPKDVRLKDLPNALQSARAFREDSSEVDRRRVVRDGTEIRRQVTDGHNRYPDYYLQNFHYQSGGWFTEDSADLYDTQVEALFTGTADAMRRAALAEISRELKGRDQRGVSLLDMACGNGRFLSQVMQVYPRLRASGLDLSPSYTEAARERLNRWPHVDILHEAAEAMPLEDDSLDMVVSIFLFHELPADVRPKVLAQVARILKPGGLFILADSVQFGDYPEMDGLLEYFPHGFHEPYYPEYLSWDAPKACETVGLVPERQALAFLTKVSTFRK